MMKNIGYLECQKGGYHTGEFLNIVCCEPGCKDNLLCCCACIEEMHQNHKTKTLKKLILDADNFIKNSKQPFKAELKQHNISLNTDIMANMVENEQKNILSKLNQLKINILKEIDDLQHGIHTYYKSLHQEISKPQEKESKDPKIQLAQAVQMVQGSADIHKLRLNVLKLINALSNFQQIQLGLNLPSEKPTQQSYLNFLKNSNIDISNIVNVKIQSLYSKFQKQAQEMKKIVSKIETFWSNNLYTFSKDMLHHSIDMINPFTIRASVDSVYQMALMNPGLNFKNGVETFTFRINVNDLQWVAVGVCYKNVAQKNNYNFRFNQDGHGCYMVSGNAGSWSHSQPTFNNSVKAFNFKQGDSITCTVTPNKICFFKNVNPELQESPIFQQKEYFELQIKHQQNDILHPCVVCYYMNTEVEYLPSFKNIQLEMPKYTYKFTKDSSHDCTIILNDIHLLGCDPTSYKCCVLDNPIQKCPAGQSKSVTFRIVRSTGGWIAIGLCHKNIVNSKDYDFLFDMIGHGCYMISANGGSWSHFDPQQNNLVKTFKFVEGDLVTISLDQQSKMINFKKGIDNYKLAYKPIEGDILYPVVVLYYPQDEVEVLPDL